MSIGAYVRACWRSAPEPVKRAARVPPFSSVKRAVSFLTRRHIQHDDVYDALYFQRVEGFVHDSAPIMAASIVEAFKPATALDVGCGTGAVLEALTKRGVRVFGLENATAGIDACRKRGVDVRQFDLERDALTGPTHYDVVISTEVAEHLPESCADRYVGLLCGAGERVIFTAAPPGQGGRDHVNEQPRAYWISKFSRNGFLLDERATQELSENWRGQGVTNWFHENLMIFRRR